MAQIGGDSSGHEYERLAYSFCIGACQELLPDPVRQRIFLGA
jgi:hypothetical protein